jgi:hypothetical protein
MGQDLNTSDQARIEWCITTLCAVKDLGRLQPLGDMWPQVVMVIGALRRVLEPNLSEQASASGKDAIARLETTNKGD